MGLSIEERRLGGPAIGVLHAKSLTVVELLLLAPANAEEDELIQSYKRISYFPLALPTPWEHETHPDDA